MTIKFETVDASLPESTRIRLEYALWQTQDLYADRFGIRYPDSIELNVTIYGDEKTFREVATAAGHPTWSGGWFKPSRDGHHQAVLFAGDSLDSMSETFLHEGSHFLVAFGGSMPRWMNEGLATGIGHAHAEANLLVVNTPKTYASFLKREGAGSVDALILDSKKWSDLPSDAASARYIRAWALCTLLMSTENGRDTLVAIAEAYRKNRDRASGLAAFQKVYRSGLVGLQKDLDAFAASPPETTTVSRTVKGALRSDDLWTSCPDGRLVPTEKGCQ